MAEETNPNSQSNQNFRWLAVEDYFNYYLPGLIWMADIALLWFLIDSALLMSVTHTLLNEHTVVSATLLIAVPYLVGVIFGFFTNWVHNTDKCWNGEPEKYVLQGDGAADELRPKRSLRLGRRLSKKILQAIQTAYSIPDADLALSKGSLYWLVHYSLDLRACPAALYRRDRVKNLMNLHEALICPLWGGSLLHSLQLSIRERTRQYFSQQEFYCFLHLLVFGEDTITYEGKWPSMFTAHF